MIQRLWLAASRAKRRLRRDDRLRTPRLQQDVIKQYAPGKSFLDVGGMWTIHGRDAFFAEESGATSVTVLDLASPDAFIAEKAKRASHVRAVQGDLHDATVRAEAGPHDVVWCSGVLYHVLDPLQTLACLRELARETLILVTATIPEVPGIKQACVWWPGLPEADRLAYQTAYTHHAGPGDRVGLSTPYRPTGDDANWFWGMSASAVSAMLEVAVGEVVDVAAHGLVGRFVVRVR